MDLRVVFACPIPALGSSEAPNNGTTNVCSPLAGCPSTSVGITSGVDHKCVGQSLGCIFWGWVLALALEEEVRADCFHRNQHHLSHFASGSSSF